MARPPGRPTPTKRATWCNKCHACHVKRRWMSPSATPATQNEGACLQVPRLPLETKVDVTKCHACHAKWRGAPSDQRRPNAPPSATSATPATQNEGVYLQVPRLPRETKVDVTQHHACHAKRRWMSTSATPATWHEGGCHQVPRLPRKVARCPGRPTATKCATKCNKCHAYHAKRR